MEDSNSRTVSFVETRLRMEGESVVPLKTSESEKDGCSGPPCFSGHPPESLCPPNSGLEDKREYLN